MFGFEVRLLMTETVLRLRFKVKIRVMVRV